MEFSTEIINILNYIAASFGIAIDWTSENVMPTLTDIATRYCTYRASWSVVGIAASAAIALIILLWVLSMAHNEKKKYRHVNAEDAMWFGLMAFAGDGLCLGVLLYNIHQFLLAINVPELILLEYVKSLMAH